MARDAARGHGAGGRRLRWAWALGALALGACATPPPPPPVSTDIDFKAELPRRAGDWLVVKPYGRVWHPKPDVVGETFVPYLTGGGWVLGPEGWTFESMYPWGKYTFHYGRWFVADDLGWLWWPDQAKASAWVAWREGDGYVGWSPLPPPELTSPHTLPPQWVYTKTKYLSARDAEKFVLSHDEGKEISVKTKPLAPAGPDKALVDAAGGLERDPRLPEDIPAVLEAPPPPQEQAEEPPPPPKKAKKKKKRKHR